MRSFLLILLSLLLPPALHAQSRSGESLFEKFRKEKRAEFELFRQEKRTEFEQYRQRLNAEYADMLDKNWKQYNGSRSEKAPETPKPKKPFSAGESGQAAPRTIDVNKVIEPEKAIPDIPVTLPVPAAGDRIADPLRFDFFHTGCAINRFSHPVLPLSDTSNKGTSEAWRQLGRYAASEQLTDDCLRLREQLNLPDWGYLLLVEKVAERLYPSDTDTRAFLTVFLLNQSGYDSRLSKRNGRLHAMIHPSHNIYDGSYVTVNGKRYYLRGKLNGSNMPIYTYNDEFRKDATPIRMGMERVPRFDAGKLRQRTYSSSSWKKAPPIEVTVNPALIEFMNAYPGMDWHLYGLSQLSRPVQETLLPAMEVIIEGLDEVAAVDMLLDYMQHGFEYMTDGDQFGYEKPFFFEENFYYPANDCEDRAILFAKLVDSLLGLDVVYLKYPRHLAAAVKFPPGAKVRGGTTVTVDGKTYHVCDPTCTDGYAGYLHPSFASSRPDVIKIKQ